MAFTPCCQNFQITIDPMDCLGVPSVVADLVWVENITAPPVGNVTLTIAGAGASGNFSATADTVLVPPPFGSSQSSDLDAFICNNTRLAQTYRFTFNWSYHVSANHGGAFGSGASFQLLAYTCGFIPTVIATANVSSFNGLSQDANSGSTNYDVIVSPCSTCNLRISLSIGTTDLSGGTSHADVTGTFSIVKL